ncbi:MAG: acyl-CoA dehydrogenase family protein [Rhodoblastus sp.]|nr:acyl-CoA dehydrogenase family protein [Rhodoblastus sp.]
MTDIVAAAEALKPEVGARADEIERARRLPRDLAETIARAGLFRMATPREIGGVEAAPADIFRAIEAVSEADASAGWCVMIGATSGMTSAWLPADVARPIFGPPEAITCGVFAPMGRAVEERDDYVVSGKWQWASGSANCDWLMGGSAILVDGAPKTLANGALDSRMIIFPREKVELIDSWNVSGLCGTGSGEMVVRDLRVPRAHSASIVADRPHAKGALYAFPVFGLLALGVASVLLGNARAAVDEFVALAGGKRPQGSARVLAERAMAQAALAENIARLRAARALMRESVEEAWDKARATGEVDLAQRAALRLAATHAARTATAVAREMAELGGGSSVFLSSPLQRRMRDAFVGAQHMMVAPQTNELTGRYFMGLPTDASFL